MTILYFSELSGTLWNKSCTVPSVRIGDGVIVQDHAILGKQPPAAALKDAASKATKLMQANQKKFGA